MPEEIKPNNFTVITCPACAGSGLVNSKKCQTCEGLGGGIWSQGRWFYAQVDLSWALIALRQIKKNVYRLLDILSIIAGLAGIAALIWWYVKLPREIMSLDEFLFWQDKNFLILIFWLSLVVDMFIIYRRRQKIYEAQKISKYAPKNKDQAAPATWEELKKYPRVNVLAGFSDELMTALEKTYLMVGQLKHGLAAPMHLFYNLMGTSAEVSGMFARMNVAHDDLFSRLGNQLNKIQPSGMSATFSPAVRRILIQGYLEAYELGHAQVKPIDLILACYQNDKILSEILYDLAVDPDKLTNSVAWVRVNDQLVENYHKYKAMARFKPSSNMDRAYTAVATPFLDQFSIDLTLSAKFARLEVCVGRTAETAEIFEHLESGKNGIVLVGETGVGKNSIAEGLAQLMVTEEVPKRLKDKRLLELDITRLLGGATAAEAQERMLQAVNEILRAGNIILYMQNVENITGLSAGSEDSLDLSEIVASAVARQGLIVIATCTTEHYRRAIEGGPLGQALAKVEVAEPEDNEAIQMIESKTAYFESKFKVYYSYDALAEAVKDTRRYMHEQYLPEKAITVLEKSAVSVAKGEDYVLVRGEDVAKVVSEVTHIPVSQVSDKESELLLNLEAEMHKRMVGQEEAVKIVAASLRRARAELREGKRPISSFLFLGPTGVGKTELAKTIAQVYFSDENYMIRVDMSEYQLAESVEKMIGSEDGVEGYLTAKVRQAPFSLILLDEIEKAHPDILNLFLQVMDDGRLTDGQGHTIDFTNSIIIATSNIGAVYIQEQVKAGTPLEQLKQVLIDKYLVEKMRPELINRFDGIVVFRPLEMPEVVTIARLMLNKTKALLDNKGMGLEVSEAGLRVLAEAGYQPEFGARPLRRLLQDKIDNIIANKILAGELARRDTVIINDRADIEIRQAAQL
jgi:ATP-dependent Clp protease ATP-binding subunit ClpC